MALTGSGVRIVCLEYKRLELPKHLMEKPPLLKSREYAIFNVRAIVILSNVWDI